ncbi:hypothetical protein BH11PSE9_BH11PSE9_05980 [soil metagenome]
MSASRPIESSCTPGLPLWPMHYEAIVACSDDAIIGKSLDGTVLSWNTAAERIFGYAAPEMVGQPMVKAFPPDRLFEEAEILGRVAAGDKLDHFETVRLHKSGRLVNVSVTISPIMDAAGRIVGVSKIARDVTQRIAADRRLAELAAKAQVFAAIVASSDDAIIGKSLEGVVTSWNPAAERIFGYTADEMVGRPMTTIFPEDRLAEETHILERIRQGLKVDHFETVRLHRSGLPVAVSVTISPIADGNGTITGVSKIARDITGRIEAERIIWHQAHHDPLTSLPNRRLFMDRLRQEITRASQAHSCFAVMCIDLDGFKQVNDKFGHQAGDRVLEACATRLTDCLRRSDTAARLGGDEFTALLPHMTSMATAASLAQRVKERLSEPVPFGPHQLEVSASIGIGFFPVDATELDELLHKADQALYAAKQGGKNRYSFTPRITEGSGPDAFRSPSC